MEEFRYLHLPEPPPSNRTGWNATAHSMDSCRKFVTVFEQVGSGMLLTILCFTGTSFVMATELVKYVNENKFERDIIDSLGGFSCPVQLKCYEGVGGNAKIKYTTLTVAVVLAELLSNGRPSQQRYDLLRRRQIIISALAAFPYCFPAFYARWKMGCAVFWHWHPRVNMVIYTSLPMNFFMAS